jgi:hypothetical protein
MPSGTSKNPGGGRRDRHDPPRGRGGDGGSANAQSQPSLDQQRLRHRAGRDPNDRGRR